MSSPALPFIECEQIHAGSDFVKIMATGGVMTPGVNPEDAHYTRAEMAAGFGRISSEILSLKADLKIHELEHHHK